MLNPNRSRQRHKTLRQVRRTLSVLMNVRLTLAFILAVVIWSAITLEENPSAQAVIQGNIPVDIAGLSSGLVVADSIPPVQVAVKGPRTNIDLLTQRSFVARIDLSEYSEGLFQIPIQVETPDSTIEILRVAPPQTTVQIDRTIEVPIRVRLILTGEVGDGFRLAEDRISFSPDNIMVTGPASTVNQVAAMQAELEVFGSTDSISRQISAVPVDTNGVEVAGVVIESRLVDVSVPVIAQQLRRTVPVRAQVTGAPASGFIADRFSVMPSSVDILGAPEDVELVDHLLTEPITISESNEDVSTDIPLIVPNNVQLLRGLNEVRVVVDIAAIPISAGYIIAVEFTNLNSGLTPGFDLNSVQVVLTGPADALQQLGPRDITATVDLSGKGAGEFDLAPIITLPDAAKDNLKIVKLTPTSIRTTLTDSVTPSETDPSATTSPTKTPTVATTDV